MSLIVNLEDLESAAVRSLTSQRCFKKAGLAVNATTNTYTITLGGTVQTGDILNVSIVTEAGTVTGHFDVTGTEDTLTKAATALEVVIEALTGIASSSTGEVITVTPTTTTQAITVTATVTGTTPTTTMTVAETIIGSKGVKTANTTQVGIDGHTGEVAATNNIAFAASDVAVIPVSSFKWYLVVIGTTGSFDLIPGTLNVNPLPDIPASHSPVGAFKIATGAAATFTPGTTSLNATGITDTYYDLSCVPKAGYPA